MKTASSKCVKLHYRNRACRGNASGNKSVPWLNISGVWLEKLGFEIGDTVRIIARDKLLIIEPLEHDAEEVRQCKTALQEVKETLKKLAQ